MTTIDSTRRTGLRARYRARDHGRHVAFGFTVACVLTACTFGDDHVLTAQTGVAANFSDCVPRECFYGCCSGPAARPEPQLVGGKPSQDRCAKLLTTNKQYAQYADFSRLDINYCDFEFVYEWGTCVPIPPEEVVQLAPDGGTAPSGLHFSECPPSGDWLAYPVADVEIVPQP